MSTRQLLDFGWRFHRGDFPLSDGFCLVDEIKAGQVNLDPVYPQFDDSQWLAVDLPHDFVIEQTIRPVDPVQGERIRNIVNKNSDLGMISDPHMYAGHGGRVGGIAWYRRKFSIPTESDGRRFTIEFDGIFRNATIYLNRHLVGRHESGYVPASFDISDQLNYGAENVLVVRVDASQYEGWWYEGGGIYRHTWLVESDPLHIADDGIFVRPEISENDLSHAKVNVSVDIFNSRQTSVNANLELEIRDPNGALVQKTALNFTADTWKTSSVKHCFELASPLLWDTQHPNLYTLSTRIIQDKSIIDQQETVFGIRSIRFDADSGFYLNGKPTKIKGVCCHQDHAGVGVALPDRVAEFRIEQLKGIGCNAYRSAHHPPAPELVAICDRKGMLMMAENRLLSGAKRHIDDLAVLIKKYRNSPSVILWSVGNEELIQGTDAGRKITQRLRSITRELDPDRPVTLAMNGAWGKGASQVVDVQGCNYFRCGDIDAFHKEMPHTPVVMSEAASCFTTRGVYKDDPLRGIVESFGNNLPSWGHSHEDNWRETMKRPFVSGTFVWTGFDYHGEQAPYQWAGYSSNFGILDLCGFPKDCVGYYKAWWTNSPVLHIFPHWNWRGQEGKTIAVWCYTNCKSVELFLNGKSMGTRTIEPLGHVCWDVPYEPGVLMAKGVDENGKVLTCEVATTTAPASIRLVSDRVKLLANAEDVAMVRVEVIDASGRVVPTADNDIVFEVTGPANVIGVGNGDPYSIEDDKFPRFTAGNTINGWPGVKTTYIDSQLGRRRAFNGLCQLILKATETPGSIGIRANSIGLRDGELTIESVSAQRRPWIA